jgi:hypothetical protein
LCPELATLRPFADPNTTASRQLQALQDAARTRGIELSIYQIAKPEEITGAIDAALAAGATALNVLASPLLNIQRRFIIERAAASRLPAIYQFPEAAEQGGLAAYGPRIVQLFRDVVSRQLVKLLKSAKPGDLPVEQPTRRAGLHRRRQSPFCAQWLEKRTAASYRRSWRVWQPQISARIGFDTQFLRYISRLCYICQLKSARVMNKTG